MRLHLPVIKFKMERNYVIRFIRHSEAPQGREFHLGGNGLGTLPRKGSPPATVFDDAGRVFCVRPEKPANRGKDFVELAARRLKRRPPGDHASSANAGGVESCCETTTRTLDSAYPVYLMAALGGRGYRRRIIENEEASPRV
jgi:hypothetical protein